MPIKASSRMPTSLAAVSLDDITSNNNDNDAPLNDRRSLFQTIALATSAMFLPSPALAVDIKKVVVAGATGQTGRRVLERLASKPGLTVVAGVRNIEKAEKALSESSTVVRGAVLQNVASVDTTNIQLVHLDVVKDSVDQLAETSQGADALVICTGFIPGNPLKMNEDAHKVDNVGTCHLVDAAAKAGVKKVAMVSSILANGRNWGQEKAPGFVVTNAFGGVLDEKIVAENYLRKSGMDYTIVRPGGLKAKPPSGALIISVRKIR
jgi:nucleoside-diphosphate-sugar epimerase